MGPSAGRDVLAGLLAAAARGHAGGDAELISRAYHVAAVVHAGQVRKSGDPYITHPVAVAAILAEAGADDQTLCAALLHDALEGTGYSPGALFREFGADIAGLVTAVAALDDGSAASAISDSRALMIKLADRLHNMRTAAPLPLATQLSKSRETLQVLVPLAGQLGLDAIGAELEELAAGTLSRYGLATASSATRLLAVAAALLPRAARTRWRDEWAGELSALPTRGQRAAFAARTLAGVPRLAATLRRPAPARGTGKSGCKR